MAAIEEAIDASDQFSTLAVALREVESAHSNLFDLVVASGLKDLTDLDEISGNTEDSRNALRRLLGKLEELLEAS